MKHFAFTSIELFKNLIKEVKRDYEYIGKDENGDPMYDESNSKPILKFLGSVKLHGSNMSIVYDVKKHDIYTQSREIIITEQNDLYGFAKWIRERRESILKFFKNFVGINKDIEYVILYGEFAGKGIQKGVAINNIDKMFFPFDIKIVHSDGYTQYILRIDYNQSLNDIKDFHLIESQYEIEIDFNDPSKSIEELERLTLEVENKCPIASKFGYDGVGEGIVWKTFDSNTSKYYRFKTKGEKHSVTKGNTASVDQEKLNSIQEFVEYCVTENRVKQGIEKIAGDKQFDNSMIGAFMKWIVEDIKKEESNALLENGLEFKDVTKAISERARKLLFQIY